MEPTDMSQRPPQLPAVMMSHDGVTIFSSAPRRLAISLPTSTSKPSISFLSLRKDCGGYSASDDMVSVLVLITRSSRSEEHTSELQSLMRISYAVFCLKKKKPTQKT